MNGWKDPRLWLTFTLIALFAGAYFRETQPDQMMKGAMIAAFAAAYGYWLGSSSGSRSKDELLAAKDAESE